MNNTETPKEIITGVSCDVSNCIYHNGIANCTAPFVNIKNKNTWFSIGTICDSYKPRMKF